MLNTINNEKGIAIIAALMVLVALTLLGISAILTSNTDMQIASNEKMAAQVQYAAEAGIEHMMVAINEVPSSLTPADPDPDWGDPYTGVDDWAPSVTGTIDGITYTATVSYKQAASSTNVAFYNQASGYASPAPATNGWPVYVITSVAVKGNYTSQTNILEVTKNEYDFSIGGAFTAGGPVELKGNPTLDGQHHDINGNVVATGSNCGDAELQAGMPGVISEGAVEDDGSVNYFNSSGTDFVQNSAGLVPETPWAAMGLKEDSSDTTTVVDPQFASGPYFADIFPGWPALRSPFGSSGLDGNQYYTSSGSNDNITGLGFLVVHNPNFVPGACSCPAGGANCWSAANQALDADCAAANAPAVLDANTGTFKGMIIADAISLRGNVTIIGAVISLSTLETEATGAGTPTISYSCQAIEQFAAGKTNKKLNWHKE